MRVLVVEDETRMSRLLKRGLEEEGHAVDLAADGPEGLWLATENAYAAILALVPRASRSATPTVAVPMSISAQPGAARGPRVTADISCPPGSGRS